MLVPASPEIPPEAGILTGTVEMARVASSIRATCCSTSLLGSPR